MTALATAPGPDRTVCGQATGSPELGALLRAYRRRAGLTQRALAKASTISVRAIRDLESGRRRHPHQETIALLADGLGISEQHRAALEMAGACPPCIREQEPVGEDQLPVPPDDLVGRHHELAALHDLVTGGGQRLVAVVGIAGIGKTRLVLELARRMRAEGPYPVRWVSRERDEQCTAPRTIGEYTLDLLRARLGDLLGGRAVDMRGVARLIGANEVLLVIDGHPRTRVGDDRLAALLGMCPNLRIVMTSRDPRRLPQGTSVPVAPLPVPPGPLEADGAHAARLLLRRIRRVRPDLRLGPDTAEAVANVCALMDGVPALLELAARWSLVYTLDELAEHLARDPLALGCWTDAAGRSYDTAGSVLAAIGRIDPPVRDLLAVLGRVEGDWSVHQAAAITGRPVPDLARDVHVLLLNGLLRRIESPATVSFRQLRLVRYFLVDAPDRAALTPGRCIA